MIQKSIKITLYALRLRLPAEVTDVAVGSLTFFFAFLPFDGASSTSPSSCKSSSVGILAAPEKNATLSSWFRFFEGANFSTSDSQPSSRSPSGTSSASASPDAGVLAKYLRRYVFPSKVFAMDACRCVISTSNCKHNE